MMSVEQRLVNDFQRVYGILCLKSKKMELGTALCYRLSTEQGEYFVKIYQTKHAAEQITREIIVCDALREKGLCVSEYIKNIYGDFINSMEYGIFTVQKFFEGRTYKKYQVPKNILFQSAELLGQIHRYLDGFEGFQVDFSFDWILETAKESRHNMRLEELFEHAETLPEHSTKHQIVEDIKWKIQMMPTLKSMKMDFDGLTRRNSHGDYNTYQWICDNEKIKAVIDFGSCSNLPVIWELIRSYTYGAEACWNGGKIDVAFYCEYLRHYLKENTLSENDLKYGFEFYYYTLLPSCFGYKQYISDYIEGKYNPLIEFALWRTNMCRYLCEHAKALDQQVYDCMIHEV